MGTPWKINGWNIQITHLKRKLIFQTPMIMFHVNLQGCSSMIPCKKDFKSNESQGYEGFRPLHHGSLGGPTLGTKRKETLDWWNRRWFRWVTATSWRDSFSYQKVIPQGNSLSFHAIYSLSLFGFSWATKTACFLGCLTSFFFLFFRTLAARVNTLTLWCLWPINSLMMIVSWPSLGVSDKCWWCVFLVVSMLKEEDVMGKNTWKYKLLPPAPPRIPAANEVLYWVTTINVMSSWWWLLLGG